MRLRLNNGVRLREVREEDYSFLISLYESTRTDVAKFGQHLSREQRYEFIKSQFDLQTAHYIKMYPNSGRYIMELDGQPVGRLFIDENKKRIHIIVLSLLEKFRNQGIGKSVLTEVKKKADELSKQLSMYVATDNHRAKDLYTSLNFKPLKQDNDRYELMVYGAFAGNR